MARELSETLTASDGFNKCVCVREERIRPCNTRSTRTLNVIQVANVDRLLTLPLQPCRLDGIYCQRQAHAIPSAQ